MSRRPHILRGVRFHTYIPEDVKARLDLHLYSSVERRIPFGDYSRLVTQLLREYLSKVEGNDPNSTKPGTPVQDSNVEGKGN